MRTTLPSKGTGVGVDPMLYRDGKLLVATLGRSFFPRRCVATDWPVDAVDYEFHGRVHPQESSAAANFALSATRTAGRIVAFLLFAPLGVLASAAISKSMVEVSFRIGVSEEYAERQSAKTRQALAWLGAAIAGLASFLIPLIYLNSRSEPVSPALRIALIVPTLLGVLVTIGALIAVIRAALPPIRIQRCDGTHVWFEGAHEGFLARLPEFPRRTH